MNFFHVQDRARAQTTRLLVMFTIAVFILCAVTYALFLSNAFLWRILTYDSNLSLGAQLWHRPTFQISTMFVLGTVVLQSLSKYLELRGGGSEIAASFGGRRIDPISADDREHTLLNIVQEMAIASGVPVPPVYVMDAEPAINAFAAGCAPSDAAISVTKGAILELDRSEMQAVIAHEFSHILNGDMRLNIRMAAVLYGIEAISHTGLWLMQFAGWTGLIFRARSRAESGEVIGRRGFVLLPIAILGLLMFAFGYLGLLLGRVIKLSISRQREFLADASAVQFTRNKAGLESALMKIGGYPYGAIMRAGESEAMSHMFVCDPVGIQRRMSPHPPLEDRIRRFLPSFDGVFTPREPSKAVLDVVQRSGGRRVAAAMVDATSYIDTNASIPINASDVDDALGSLDAEEIAKSQSILESLPNEIIDAAYTGLGAVTIIYALALDDDPSLRDPQIFLMRSLLETTTMDEVERALVAIEPIPRHHYLALAELCAPGLKTLCDAQRREFMSVLSTMIHDDGHVSLFEFLLLKNVKNWVLRPSEQGTQPRFLSSSPLVRDISILLSSLAHIGHRDAHQAATAFRVAAKSFPQAYERTVELISANKLTFTELERAIDRIGQSADLIKEHVVRACVRVVVFDEQVTTAEAHLLRLTCDALGVPAPPIVSQASRTEDAAHGAAMGGGLY